MKKARRIITLILALALAATIPASAQTNRRRRPPATTRPAPTARTTAPARSAAPTAADARLTGHYRLNVESSDDPRAAAERATKGAFGLDQNKVDELTARLTSPDQLSLERRGNNISIASTRAPRITFSANGGVNTELAADGQTVRTRADLISDQLTVTSTGTPDNQFSVTFVSVDEGQRLRVIRTIISPQTDKPVIVQSVYDRVSPTARFSIYGEPETARTGNVARNNRTQRPAPPVRSNRDTGPQTSPPVMSRRPPQTPPPAEADRAEGDLYLLVIPSGTQFVATLDNDLTTDRAREGDRFSMTVRAPAEYEGATIEGTVARVDNGGRVSGRSQMSLDFQQIRLRDGRTAGFNGTIESVRPVGGDEVRVDAEAGDRIEERGSRSNRTAQRAAIGAAVGAIIGAIAKGGKGAAIGAAIGAGAGASSVYIQGRDNLELRNGTELTIRAGAPPNQR